MPLLHGLLDALRRLLAVSSAVSILVSRRRIRNARGASGKSNRFQRGHGAARAAGALTAGTARAWTDSRAHSRTLGPGTRSLALRRHVLDPLHCGFENDLCSEPLT